MAKRHIPINSSHRAKRKRVGVGAAALFACLGVFIILIGVVIGRYQTRKESDRAVKALDFYFTSDFLDGSTHTLAPGSREVTFTLSNHADELRYSEVEITYEVKVEPAEGVSIIYGNSNKTFQENNKQDDTVTISNLNPGIYTVTATGRGGYEKTLTGKIEVLPSEAKLYQHADVTSDYTLLTVWNEGDIEETVDIQYAGIPDNTNPNMTDWTTGTATSLASKTVTIPAHTSMVFRFFESGTITVTKSGTATAVDKAQLPN